MTQKVRASGRIVNVAVIIAVGRERWGPPRSARLRLVHHRGRRRLARVSARPGGPRFGGHDLGGSDAHAGLVDAVRSTLTGATWQRRRTHLTQLLTRVPRSAQPIVATLARTIFAQPDATSVWDQRARVVERLSERFPAAAELLAEAAPSEPLDRARSPPDDRGQGESPVGAIVQCLEIRAALSRSQGGAQRVDEKAFVGFVSARGVVEPGHFGLACVMDPDELPGAVKQGAA
jgi:hypothetical protein